MADELFERMEFLRKRLLALEWDKANNQLNPGMAHKLAEFKKEYAELAARRKPE